jgi:hypothetical protein
MSNSQVRGQSNAKRDLLLAIGALVVFVLVSFGVLMAMNPANIARLRAMAAKSPVGEKPIEITLVHTNDTWGYTQPCG